MVTTRRSPPRRCSSSATERSPAAADPRTSLAMVDGFLVAAVVHAKLNNEVKNERYTICTAEAV